jgi:N-acetylglucosamine-6-phosphate deacetylase
VKGIQNGKIILPDQILTGYTLLYTDVIVDIVPDAAVPQGTALIDAKGGYVAPGLIDLHIHGYLGADVCDCEKEGIRTIAKGIVQNGVTGFLPTTMTVDKTVIRKALETCRELQEESRSWDGAAILGCHAEGPFISEKKKGAQSAEYILKPDADFIREYRDIIKILTLAPETDTENFSAIRQICAETDVVVSMGHTDADYDTAVKGVEAGVRHATHLFNAMSPLAHRAPGVVGASLNTDVTCELIVDTFHVLPCLYNMVFRMKGRKLCFITDCLSAGGLPMGEYVLGGKKVIYRDVVCRLEDGTVAGSVLKLNEGIWNAYQNSDIPLWECVNCATLNPANAIGLGKTKGSLEKGKDADIIITDETFGVQKTIIAGEVRFRK